MPGEVIIITGGSGFVGRYLTRELVGAGKKVIVWDRQVDDLPAGVEGAVIDITSPETYRARLKKWQPAWVIHLAAISSVPEASRDPKTTYRVNVEGTLQLLEAIEEVGPETKMLVVSTSEIYGQGSDTPLPELPLDEAVPGNPYAKTKWQMEKIIEERFLQRVLRVRPFPHIGPGQALGFVSADFASQIAAIEEGRQKPLMKVGNLKAKRDFTDVRDVVRAYRLLLEKGELGNVYHVASGRAVMIQELLDRLLSFSQASIKVAQDPEKMRPSDIPVLVGDASLLRQATGWHVEIPLEQTLRDILGSWRQKVREIP